MLETKEPHLNKEIAYITYHLSCLKPFSANEVDKDFFGNNEKMYEMFIKYYNEIIIYYIIKNILDEYNSKININNYDAKYFFHCLKYRNLSRSSLEFIFQHIISM